jgi:phage baseplate assembly protein W
VLSRNAPPAPSLAGRRPPDRLGPDGVGFLGKGWRFPIEPDARGRLGFAPAEQDVEQAIWLILATAPGERVMLPEFGCGMHDLVFEPNSDLLRAAVAARVRAALVRWEPRIDVQQVSAEAPDGEPNLVLVRVDYRIRSTNTITNVVYPFFITEGGA